MSLLRRNVLAIGLGLALAGVAGCGGGSGPAGGDAGVAVRVQWPSTRLIPAATRSIRVDLRDAVGFETFRVVNRPDSGNLSTLVFFGLAPGPLDFSAQAFPLPDAQGVAVASAVSRVTLAAGEQTDVTLSLNSTVTRIEISPTRLDLVVGGTGTLTATARDVSGNAVPLTASKTEWVSDDATIARVSGAGVVTAVKAGSALITFTDTESGRSNSVIVAVTAPAP